MDPRIPEMNKRNGKGSAWRRVLHRIRMSRIADVLSIVIIAVGILLLFHPLIPEDGKSEEVREESQPAQPVVNEVSDQCTYGTVSVYYENELVYEYSGEVIIRNDGKNGREIEMQIQYPKGTYPCSCMAEQKGEK